MKCFRITTLKKLFYWYIKRQYQMPEKWYYFCYAFLAFLLYINYNLFKLRGSNEDTPQIQKVLGKRSYQNQSCCNPLLCSLEGKWHIRNNVRFSDYRDVENTNMQLRMRKGWPSKLYHGDLRCGMKYPLARSVRYNNSEIYFLDVVSQCDNLGNAPCCRDDIGWCGRGDWYCKCNSCFDYGKFIHTELAEWKHRLNCSKYNKTYLETCDFLSREFSSILFIGDSLVRHLFSSLLIHLTNDTRYGALKSQLHEHEKEYCGYENQFVDSSCHIKLATDWGLIRKNENYCKNSFLIPEITFVEAYSIRQKDLAWEAFQMALQGQRPLILIGIGIHDNFDSKKVINDYLSPLVALRNQYRGKSDPLLIWLNTHAAGPLKPMGYRLLQGNKNILKFNKDLQNYCQKNLIYSFDTYNITKGVHSFDGTHYGSTLNRLKVELLLDALENLP